MSEAVALNKKRQSKFAKKAAKLKNKIQKGEITIKEDVPKATKYNPYQRGVVYLGHIPHGFYEKEMFAYFKQFGKVTNVRVCRSFKTGKSKGFGFVEFLVPEVAEVAAETMHNYLMFNRRLEAKYIPPEKQNDNIFKGESWAEKSTPYKKVVNLATRKRNLNITPQKHILKAKKRISKLNNTANKLKALGITLNVRPVDVPTEIKLPAIEEPKKAKVEIEEPKKTNEKVKSTKKTRVVKETEAKIMPVVKETKTKKVKETKTTKNISSQASTKIIKKLPITEKNIIVEPRITRNTNKLVEAPKSVKKAMKLSNGFICEDETSFEESPKKRKSGFISETEMDTSFEDSPKKKRVVRKKANVVMKQMSDKLRMATMSILNSDLVVKKKGKIEKKVIKKKK